MKFTFLFFSLIFSAKVFATVSLDLFFKNKEVNLGELIEAEFRANGIAENELKLKILNNNLADVFHVVDLKGNTIKGFFYKIPKNQDNSIKKDIDIEVKFYNVEIKPIQEEQQLIFENFDVKKSLEIKWFFVFLGIIFFGASSFFIFRYVQKLKLKKIKIEKLKEMKEELLHTKKLEDIIKIWEKRKEYFEIFPHVEPSFLKFEAILNQYQFKPNISETEKIEIVESYRKFIKTIEGGFNGV